jgi:hypothetical protein
MTPSPHLPLAECPPSEKPLPRHRPILLHKHWHKPCIAKLQSQPQAQNFILTISTRRFSLLQI